MRVCVASTVTDARDDRMYFKEARSLAKEHSVTILAPSINKDVAWKDDEIEYEALGSDLSWSSRGRAVVALFRAARRGRFDVIHVVDAEVIPFLPFLRVWSGARTVCDVWEADYERILGHAARPSLVRSVAARAFVAVERWAAKRSDLVIVADTAIAASLSPGVSAKVIFNYPVLEVLAGSGAREILEERFGPARWVVYAGSMSEERGILAAARAIELVRVRIPEARLLLVGAVPDGLSSQLGAWRAASTPEPVVQLGFVDHSKVGGYLAAAEVGIIPFARTPKFEKNIPQKLFEYWASGLPVVATDLPPIRPYVEQCSGGLLTPTNSPEDLARGLLSVLSDADEARLMGQRGKEMVQSLWNWGAMEPQLLAAYRSLGERLRLGHRARIGRSECGKCT